MIQIRQLVPDEERLTLLRVFTHSDWLAHIVFAILLASIVATIIVWAAQALAVARGRGAWRESALAYLSAIIIAAPLLAFVRAIYEVMKVCMGLVNVRPAPDLVMFAPALAEAAMFLLIGALAAAIAAAARGHLLILIHAPPRR
ncbi:hypothetical protein [Phenylobacterium sp.]|uniref:hypothetical protein n=1 Tax=Phenylobacterium sp. TaxID=1871053 RepID=UPI0028A13B51|nr:hypothetical protein [Phenylobacterium sp.]